MRRILFTALASTALLATAPVLALARDHHRRHDRPHAHHARGHHARDHLRRFGSDNHVGGERTAGTVMSFTNGVLRIALNHGSTVSGSVTKRREHEQMCTVAALAPGTVVHEAELRVSSVGASWDKIELITSRGSAPSVVGSAAGVVGSRGGRGAGCGDPVNTNVGS